MYQFKLMVDAIDLLVYNHTGKDCGDRDDQNDQPERHIDP
jgi:hypothetical protein